MQVALFSLFLALTVLKKVVVNDKQLTFFVPSHLTEYVIQNFQMTEEKAEEEREKIKKKIAQRCRDARRELKKSKSAGYGVSEARLWPGMGCFVNKLE